jgi:hypothetical protein
MNKLASSHLFHIMCNLNVTAQNGISITTETQWQLPAIGIKSATFVQYPYHLLHFAIIK